MEQNKEKISSKIKGIKFVMDNGEEKYQKGSFVFGCAISIEDKHCESFMIGECPLLRSFKRTRSWRSDRY